MVGGGGGLVPMNSSSQCSDPRRPKKRPSATARKTDVKMVVTLSVRSNVCTPQLALSADVQNKVTEMLSKKATVEEHLSSKTIHPAMGVHLHLPVRTAFLGSELILFVFWYLLSRLRKAGIKSPVV